MKLVSSVLGALFLSAAVSAQTHPGDGGAEHCRKLTPRAGGPRDINDVRFDELDVITAMGDSISACTGCNWDEVWSHGAKNNTDTMGSLFQYFSPSLYGQATSPRDSALNFAVPGAVASSMPAQARRLRDGLRADNNVNFDNDWKLLTFWIGGNNVCAACRGGQQHTPAGYKASIVEALEILSDIPRLRVTMLTQPKYSSLYYLTHDVARCAMNRVMCGCVMSSEQDALESDALAREYSRVTHEAAEEWDGRGDNFAVSVQTADDSEVNSLDYLWPVDCFHFNDKLHLRMGHTFFNSLQLPPAEKPTAIDYESPEIVCPTEDDRLH